MPHAGRAGHRRSAADADACGRARAWAAAGGRGAVDARRCSSPITPIPGPHVERACCSRCSTGSRRPGQLALQAGERLRELDRRRRGEQLARRRSPRRRRPRRRRPSYLRDASATCSRPDRPPRSTLDLRADARPFAVRARPLRRGGTARPAGPRARRRAGRHDAARSGGRCRRSSTPARGEHADAERLAREAVAISERTDDSPVSQGDALCDLAEVLDAAGRRDEAVAALAQALDRYERKPIIPVARRVREQLEALQETAI